MSTQIGVESELGRLLQKVLSRGDKGMTRKVDKFDNLTIDGEDEGPLISLTQQIEIDVEYLLANKAFVLAFCKKIEDYICLNLELSERGTFQILITFEPYFNARFAFDIENEIDALLAIGSMESIACSLEEKDPGLVVPAYVGLAERFRKMALQAEQIAQDGGRE